MKTNSKKILASLALSALVFVGCTNTTEIAPAENTTPGEIGMVTWCFKESVDMDEVCYENVEFIEEDNAYSTLSKFAEDEESLSVEATDYGPDLGYFVTSINGVAGDADAFWKLYVNGAESQAGISSITPEEGDKFDFKYEAVEEYSE